ncbi:MAG: hypothetical protein A2096_02160 [Spirochaetes bacterium GWF1_41_5]|nr:MAG: hypothetical protein A2096_02160 [Spirochaetes bacterium GWF1_41_5]HBE04031.1 hypothetical protein [Spirochaetia bacterium]
MKSKKKFKCLHYMEKIDMAKYRPFIHASVKTPVPYGVSLDIPAQAASSPLINSGLVDVCASPFFADAGGIKDATKAIQAAVNFARDHQLVCFFPPGQYRISDTISCIQNLRLSEEGALIQAKTFPCILSGSARQPKQRPKIILSAHSRGFHNPKQPKYIIDFWARSYNKLDPEKPQPNICMNQMLINIDIDIEEGNAGAVGVHLQGAQGSGVQDTTINAVHGFAGLCGGVGSGGCHAGITVIGGRIGLDLRETNPVPTIAGITLLKQTDAAILFSGAQALSAVGIKIVSGTNGPAIKIEKNAAIVEFNGHVSLVDTEIIFDQRPGGGSKTGISSARNVYLHNVYMQYADNAIINSDGSGLKGNPSGWIQINEYAHAIDYEEMPDKIFKNISYKYSSPVYCDGKKITDSYENYKNDIKPECDFVQKHLWKADFPAWESPGAVNIKNPAYNAKGNGCSDDTEALQKAINEHEIIFLPKGYYRITRTITCRPETKLIGVARHLSVILIQKQEPFFSDPENARPLLETADDPGAETILFGCGIEIPVEATGAYALLWRCGGKSVFRSAHAGLPPKSIEAQMEEEGFPDHPAFPQRLAPLIIITGNGSGKWYAYNQDESPWAPGPDYRHILIKDTCGPLDFYQCNAEHTYSGLANMEICNSQNISIYGLKSEGHELVMIIKNSQKIRIFSYGGIGNAGPGNELFRIINSSDFLITNTYDILMWYNSAGRHWSNPKCHIIYFNDPRTWFMISEETGTEKITTQPLERPLLYKRGNP